MKLAMIGLGKMGGNMATRLVQKGISVVGFDRSTEVVKSDMVNFGKSWDF